MAGLVPATHEHGAISSRPSASPSVPGSPGQARGWRNDRKARPGTGRRGASGDPPVF